MSYLSRKYKSHECCLCHNHVKCQARACPFYRRRNLIEYRSYLPTNARVDFCKFSQNS